MGIFQDIKKNFTLENAYEDWEQYRNTLTDYLLKTAEAVNMPEEIALPTLAVIGAGACNDLDLKKILPFFSQITLIDIDTDGMKKALYRYDLEENDKISVNTASLTGISEAQQEAFADALRYYLWEQGERITPGSFCEFAMEYIEEQYQDSTIPNGFGEMEEYDFVWCLGVHSQLQSMYGYIFHSFLVNLKQTVFRGQAPDETLFMDFLKQKNRSLIPKLNDLLLSVAKKICIIGNEWDVISDPQAQYYIEEYPQYPVEGAYQAIVDIRNRKYEVRESMIMWPFHKKSGIYYQMLLQKIDKTL